MRIAILSAVESIDGDNLSPRGHVRIGGKSLLQHQMELALSLGCSKVACISMGLPAELVSLQHMADAAKVQFRCIRDIRALSAWVSASDELLVIQDGLAITPANSATLALKKRSILTFPEKEGTDAGFERIDRQASWAGIMIVPGSLVERLTDLPDDFDIPSSLLRSALQAGVPSQPLDAALIGGRGWAILTEEKSIAEFSGQWISSLSPSFSPASPVRWMAELGAKQILQRNTDPARAANLLFGAACLALLMAAGAIWYEAFSFAFVSVALAVFGFATANALRRMIAGDSGNGPAKLLSGPALQNIGVDCLLVAIVAAAAPPLKMAASVFALLALIGMLRIIAVKGRQVLWPWLSDVMTDRGLIAIICALAAYFDVLVPVIQLVALVIIFAELVRNYRSQLT